MQTENEHLLTCLGEEGAEVTKECAKALRFGIGDLDPETGQANTDKIMLEFIDLYAVVEMLQEKGVLVRYGHRQFRDAIQVKKEKVLKYMEYARENGTLEPKDGFDLSDEECEQLKQSFKTASDTMFGKQEEEDESNGSTS